jgi:hypothetical protein
MRLAFGRVDASSKQRFEPGIDARTAERAFHERIEAERWQVAFVERDRVPQINRTRVVRGVGDEIEQRGRARPVARVPLLEEGGRGHRGLRPFSTL